MRTNDKVCRCQSSIVHYTTSRVLVDLVFKFERLKLIYLECFLLRNTIVEGISLVQHIILNVPPFPKKFNHGDEKTV